ncbi:hypothetical protein CIP107503_00485 [Corynebacterium diphtheriae]|nr:hypothetical protein CIP107503_00485 [Corynebacterium diphtheriae]CAB0541559.1 hypothetical protein CIP107528_00624 [Corynebacterium diphtheriae]CAB1031176.1 hypothetical protein NCTC10648_00485 [Corynebacterium diphtheriae]CAB1031424.1 hypothetical protein FRC0546_00485 [Corynebacterium diphtheriae]
MRLHWINHLHCRIRSCKWKAAVSRTDTSTPVYCAITGMTPSWVARSRPLVGVILAVALIVTGIFKANVEHQSGAYATGACAVTLWSIGAPAHPTTHASNHGGNRRIFVITLIFIYITVGQHDRTSGKNSRFCLHHPHGRGCTLRIIDVTPQTTNAKKRKRAAKTTSPTPRHWCF